MQLFRPFARQKPAPAEVSLAQVRVASPCPADWEKMIGDERVRHCAECNLNVYNLSAMSEREATALLVEREGRICIRFYGRADGTMLTQDCPWSLRVCAIKALRLATTMLAALMGSGFALAKSRPPQAACKLEQTRQKESGVNLTVMDKDGAVIPHAKITLSDPSGKVKLDGFTGPAGTWSQPRLAPGEYGIMVESRGFRTFHGTVKVEKEMLVALKLKLSVGETSETVVIQGAPPMVMGTVTGMVAVKNQPPVVIPATPGQRTPLRP